MREDGSTAAPLELGSGAATGLLDGRDLTERIGAGCSWWVSALANILFLEVQVRLELRDGSGDRSNITDAGVRILDGGDDGDGRCERAATGKDVYMYSRVNGRGRGRDVAFEGAALPCGEDCDGCEG